MTLGQRFYTLYDIFERLTATTSRNDKLSIVAEVPEELKEDFTFCLEVLAGRHKIGWTYVIPRQGKDMLIANKQYVEEQTVKQYISRLFIGRYDVVSTYLAEIDTGKYSAYVEPIVNRRLRLGIGPSLLEKSLYAPMLAKKFDAKYLGKQFTITEKLDGNRCIAYYEDERWHYVSRNGKPMNVEFDMSNMNPAYIYDGEILSPLQVEMSNEIVKAVQSCKIAQTKFDSQFNNTSGLINRKSGNKDLVYNVFDVITTYWSYSARRDILYGMQDSSNVRILPVLARMDSYNTDVDALYKILDIVTSVGGEGLMINNEHATYVNKRTSELLKLKKSYSIDMKVTSYQYGAGKYKGVVGALSCEAKLPDKTILCNVGTGMSDEQRSDWAINPTKILGKIVEVQYFSLSQDEAFKGTNCYSLRFPRFVRIREDKTDISID